MKKTELTQIIKEELQNIMKEALPASGTPQFNQLVKLLLAAGKQAEIVGKDAQKNPSYYEGSEWNDVSMLLEEIWNGFSTGKRNDSSNRDEIFK
jgi:hypothetical protein